MKKLFSVPEIVDHIVYANTAEEAIEIIANRMQMNKSSFSNSLVKEVSELDDIPNNWRELKPCGWDFDSSSVEEIFSLILFEKEKMNNLQLGTRVFSQMYRCAGTIVEKGLNPNKIFKYLVYMENYGDICRKTSWHDLNEIKLLETK